MKAPVFSGPSGRKPGRRFRPGSGDYVSNNPLNEMDDSVLTTVPPPAGLGLSVKERADGLHSNPWIPKVSEQITEDLQRLMRGRGERIESARVREALARAGIDPDNMRTMPVRERREVHNTIVKALRAEIKERGHKLESELVGLNKEERVLKEKIHGGEELLERLQRPLVMERPQGSSYHHLLDFLKSRTNYEMPDSTMGFLSEQFQIFLIEHDWASAFRGAGEFADGDVPLPYDYTCFEMRVNGVRLVLLVGGESKLSFLALGVAGTWFGTTCTMQPDGSLTDSEKRSSLGIVLDDKSNDALLDFIKQQVRAACIMIDAEVAETELRCAPERLNHARERQGRTLLRDYHVVRLAHRHRVRAAEGRAADFDPNYTRKRLHFRRGHDRRYPNYKVWIKWQLVGDPDLGFVDKEYRL